MFRKDDSRHGAPLASLVVMTLPTSEVVRAFTTVAFPRLALGEHEGGRFMKSCGTGRGLGFGRVPHPSRVALFSTWDDEAGFSRFLRSRPITRLRERALRFDRFLLRPLEGRGEWDGEPLFRYAQDGAQPATEVAVLTRATIRLAKLPAFWSRVASVAAKLEEAPGLRYALGFGERPWIRQATFSVWSKAGALGAFAYGDPVHAEVVRRTREEGWYAEEMFVRFEVLESNLPREEVAGGGRPRG